MRLRVQFPSGPLLNMGISKRKIRQILPNIDPRENPIFAARKICIALPSLQDLVSGTDTSESNCKKTLTHIMKKDYVPEVEAIVRATYCLPRGSSLNENDEGKILHMNGRSSSGRHNPIKYAEILLGLYLGSYKDGKLVLAREFAELLQMMRDKGYNRLN